jgi:hypothetical protein
MIKSQKDHVNDLLFGAVKKGVKSKKVKMKEVFIGGSNKPIKYPKTLAENYEDMLKKDKLSKLVSKYNR